MLGPQTDHGFHVFRGGGHLIAEGCGGQRHGVHEFDEIMGAHDLLKCAVDNPENKKTLGGNLGDRLGPCNRVFRVMAGGLGLKANDVVGQAAGGGDDQLGLGHCRCLVKGTLPGQQFFHEGALHDQFTGGNPPAGLVPDRL
ncbi:hypothetical protein [Desulfosarcina cetonica]|uniref:hypothetical protein n=1 Tax=Desulfosarcina cetonica TaxID=90730 RepID=UPI0009FA1ECD|nr:hypothetical protein [Desulfosarcina cetonica]